MNKPRLSGAVCACVFTFVTATSHAALVSRLGGLAVYDTDLDITWLANANLADTIDFGVAGINANGSMKWNEANSWITAMNAYDGTGYLGINNWRLPTTNDDPDSTCTDDTAGNTPSSDSIGWNCTGSEMGHLFYTEFGATAGTSVLTTGNATELAKFTNVQSHLYWSGTEDASNLANAWTVNFHSGRQGPDGKSSETSNDFVWAVRDGDVGAVPIPAAVWLFGSGLLGLLGIFRRKK